jgi:hypothetical protein
VENIELERRAKITRDEYGGVQPMHMVFYHQSIHYSVERCLVAFQRYDQLLESSDCKAIDLISTVQEAIGHAALLHGIEKLDV